jgi:hypothetical protein
MSWLVSFRKTKGVNCGGVDCGGVNDDTLAISPTTFGVEELSMT